MSKVECLTRQLHQLLPLNFISASFVSVTLSWNEKKPQEHNEERGLATCPIMLQQLVDGKVVIEVDRASLFLTILFLGVGQGISMSILYSYYRGIALYTVHDKTAIMLNTC